MATLISVISSKYCLPNSIKLTIDADKGVTYINNKVIFRADHSRRVLRDVSGNPVLTLYKKRMTMHGRWQVFKQGSTNSDDLLFAVKRSSIWTDEENIDLDIFLAKNTEERVWDFKVKAAGKRSCDICAHGSSTILAKMTNKGVFEVEVQPNVDYAFIVALLMIVDEINNVDNAGKVEGEKSRLPNVDNAGEVEGEKSRLPNAGAVEGEKSRLPNVDNAGEVEGEKSRLPNVDNAGEVEGEKSRLQDMTDEAAIDAYMKSGETEKGADVNDTAGATEKGADVNDTAGATEEGADHDVNDTTGATEERGGLVNVLLDLLNM